MTIFPSFIRRSGSRRRNPHRSSRSASRTFRCESLETRRLLAIDVFVNGNDPLNANNVILLPNTPGQVIEIMASNTGDPGDKISALNLNAQLGDGDLNPGGAGDEPDFEAVEFTGGTVWDDQAAFLPVHENLVDTVVTGDNGEPSYAVSGALLGDNGATPCAAGVCDFAPDGVIARLIVDTTGFTSGTFPLNLSSGDPGATHFVNSNLYEEQTIDLDGATGGQFQLRFVQFGEDGDPGNDINHDTVPLSPTATAADVQQALDDLDNGNLLFPVEVTGSAGNWVVSFQGPNKFNDIGNLQIINSTLTGGGGSPAVTEDVAGRTFQTIVPNITDATVTIANRVEDRHIFYDNSFYDSSAFFGFPDDDTAIDDTKSALLPGGTATFANYTGTAKGINGIMIDVMGEVDVAGIENLANLSDNFDFTVNVDNITFNPTPSFTDFTLAAAPNPTNITVRPGDGENGSDRISIFWNDGAIQKQWLRVTLKASPATRLLSDDVFYFGNEIGETGNSTTNAFVDGTDFGGTRDNPRNFLNRAPVGDPYDFNKDSFVDGTDLGVPRDNPNNFLSALKLISAPTSFSAKVASGTVTQSQKTDTSSESEVVPQPALSSEGELSNSPADNEELSTDTLDSTQAPAADEVRVSILIEYALKQKAERLADTGETQLDYDSYLTLLAEFLSFEDSL